MGRNQTDNEIEYISISIGYNNENQETNIGSLIKLKTYY